MIHGGAGRLFYRGASHANPAWSLFVVHPGEVHSNRATHESGCDFRTMTAAPALLKEAAEATDGKRHGEPFFASPVMRDDRTLWRFVRLHQLLELPASRLETDAAFLDMLTELVRRHAQDPPQPSRIGREPKAARAARDYLEAHASDDVPLDRLASAAGLSPYHLSRVFKRTYGLPPHAFQTQLRLARAQCLLRDGRAVAHVAAETGFADQSHFTRRFKRVVGVTPGAYRTSVRGPERRPE